MSDQQDTPATDNFEAAFALITAEEAGTPQDTVQGAAADTVQGAADTVQGAADTVQGAAADTVQGAAADTVQGAADTVQGAAQDTVQGAAAGDDALLTRFAEIVRQAGPKGGAPQPPAAQPPAAQPPDVFTADERTFLDGYEKDWPDVARAESLRRRAEYRDLVGYIFQEVAKELQPVLQNVRVLSERTHLTDLQTTVPDYEDVRDKVIQWTEEQPPYLQAAYKHVIAQGTVDEVADLITRYRRDSGAAAPAPGQVPAQQAQVPAARRTEPELPAATKQAAAALAPVGSKRTAPVQAVDPSDFEAAFAQFAGKL